MTYPANLAENVAYAYDDPTAGYHGIGRLASIADDSGSTAYRYDACGNIVHDSRVIDGGTHITQYTYDIADRVARIVYPFGRRVRYDCDALGRVNLDLRSCSRN